MKKYLNDLGARWCFLLRPAFMPLASLSRNSSSVSFSSNALSAGLELGDNLKKDSGRRTQQWRQHASQRTQTAWKNCPTSCAMKKKRIFFLYRSVRFERIHREKGRGGIHNCGAKSNEKLQCKNSKYTGTMKEVILCTEQ